MNHASGQESHGVHVCHKCGWSFRNAHPNAKHRRAHKKVCGKIEGFKIISPEEGSGKPDPAVSDGGLSDEDHKSPVKSTGEGSKESTETEVERQVSCKSEEEVFADAISDFTDVGTSGHVEATAVADPADCQLGSSVLDTPIADRSPQEYNSPCDDQFWSPAFLTSSSGKRIEDEKQNESDNCPDLSSSEVSQVGAKPLLNGSIGDTDRETPTLSCSIADISTEACENTESPTSEILPAKVGLFINEKVAVKEVISDCNSTVATTTTISLQDASVNLEDHQSNQNDVPGLQNIFTESSIFQQVPVSAENDSHVLENGMQIDSEKNRTTEDGNSNSDISEIISDTDKKELDFVTETSQLGHKMSNEVLSSLPASIIEEDETGDTSSATDSSQLNLTDGTQVGGAFRLSAEEELVLGEHEEPSMPEDMITSHTSADSGATQFQDRSLALDSPKEDAAAVSFFMTKIDASEDQGSPVLKACASAGNLGNYAEVKSEEFSSLHVQTMVAKLPDELVQNDQNSVLGHDDSGLNSTSQMSIEDREAECYGSNELDQGKYTLTNEGQGPKEQAIVSVSMVVEDSDAAPPSNSTSQMSIEDREAECYGSNELEQGKYTLTNEGQGPKEQAIVSVSMVVKDSDAAPPEEKSARLDSAGKGVPLGCIGETDTKLSEGSVKQESYVNICTSEEAQGPDVEETFLPVQGDVSVMDGAPSEIMQEEFGDGNDHASSSSDGDHMCKSSRANLSLINSTAMEDRETAENHFVCEKAVSDITTTVEGTPEEAIKDLSAENVGANLGSTIKRALEDRETRQNAEHTESSEISSDLHDTVFENAQANIGNLVARPENLERTEYTTSDSKAKICLESVDGRHETEIQNVRAVQTGSPKDGTQTKESNSLDVTTAPNERALDSGLLDNLSQPEPHRLLSSEACDEHPQDSAISSFLEPAPGEPQCQVGDPGPEECSTSICDTQIHARSSVTKEGNSSQCFSEGDPVLKEKVADGSLKQDGNTSVLASDTSVDSISQSDSVEGNWGSVSDGTAQPPPITAETPNNAASDSYPLKSNNDDVVPIINNDVFEAPSFMTLVETQKGGSRPQPSSSSEIQQAQDSQAKACWFPSVAPGSNESPGRKKNEEIIAKVVNWNPGKPHTPLRSLLVEANLEKKNHSPKVPYSKDQEPLLQENYGSSGNMASEQPAEPKPSIKGVMEKEWNSPARLPVTKREKRRGKAYWVPFVCCSSMS